MCAKNDRTMIQSASSNNNINGEMLFIHQQQAPPSKTTTTRRKRPLMKRMVSLSEQQEEQRECDCDCRPSKRTCQRPQQHKKSVRFFPQVQIAPLDVVYLSLEELSCFASDMWYTSQELEEQKRESRFLCSQLKLDPNLVQEFEQLEQETSTQQQQDDNVVVVDDLNDCELLCLTQKAISLVMNNPTSYQLFRGLERWSADHTWLAKRLSALHVRTIVLLEQAKQRVENKSDNEQPKQNTAEALQLQLANVYRQANKPTVDYARILGVADSCLLHLECDSDNRQQ